MLYNYIRTIPSIVRTSLEYHLWTKAQTNNEWATTRFWEHYIRGEYPCEDNWVVASQQPPTDDPEDLRRVELVVDKWTGEFIHRLFIFEAKKKKANQSEIDELEHQAYEACLKHLKYTGRDQMYAMTVIGTGARLWVVHRDDDYLIPWIPMGTNLADKSSYIKAHSSDGSEIEAGWAYTKKNKQMSRSRLDRLRITVHTAVESNQPSANDSSANPGSGSSYTVDTQYDVSAASAPRLDSYTIPIVQDSSTYRVEGSDNPAVNLESASGFGDIVSGDHSDDARISNPSEEDSPGQEVGEHHTLVPEDAVFVEVQVETKESGEVYHFFIEKDHYRKESGDWEDGEVKYQGKIYPCVFCTWKKTGMNFWTWSLRDAIPYSKGKGKGKK